MTENCGLFDATKGLSTPIEICMGDDTCYDVKSYGDVQLHLLNDMSKKLKDVWYVVVKIFGNSVKLVRNIRNRVWLFS